MIMTCSDMPERIQNWQCDGDDDDGDAEDDGDGGYEGDDDGKNLQ